MACGAHTPVSRDGSISRNVPECSTNSLWMTQRWDCRDRAPRRTPPLRDTARIRHIGSPMSSREPMESDRLFCAYPAARCSPERASVLYPGFRIRTWARREFADFDDLGLRRLLQCCCGARNVLQALSLGGSHDPMVRRPRGRHAVQGAAKPKVALGRASGASPPNSIRSHFHLDEAAAGGNRSSKVWPLPGWQPAAILQCDWRSTYIRSRPHPLLGLAVDDLRWLAPVRPW